MSRSREEQKAPMTLDGGIASRLKRDANGLITAIAQERGTGKVLMVAWMDDVALARTLETREATYYSRSRQQNISDSTAQKIDSEIRRLIESAYKDANDILTAKRDQLEVLAKGLLEFETLSGHAIAHLLAGVLRPGFETPG